jgi:hypothetical protein
LRFLLRGTLARYTSDQQCREQAVTKEPPEQERPR